MKSIQDLRETRHALKVAAQRMIDDHQGEAWTPAIDLQFKNTMARLESVDADILGIQADLDRDARKAFPDFGDGKTWVDGEGRIVPVAYKKRGALSAQLSPEASRPQRESGMTMGAFLRGVAGMKTHESVRNALSTGTDTAGGFTLPAFLQGQMLDALAPVSSLLTAGAGLSVLDEGAKSCRIAAIDTIPTAAWRAEGGTVATSDPAFRAVDIVPRSLAFQFKVSREILMDAANLEPALYGVIAQSFAKELDRAGLRGSGTAPEIRGILNTTNVQSVTNGVNGASLATTAYANFIAAMQAILNADAPAPTAAIMHPRSFSVLAGLLDTTNQPRRVPSALEKWAFVPTSQLPINLTVGSSTDCSEMYVGDFSSVLFMMREVVSIALLQELYAGTGEIGFIAHARVDVAVTYPKALAVVTGVRP